MEKRGQFEYIKGTTTADDVIEHLLMRLNTDFVGCALQLEDFCAMPHEHYYDTLMVKKVKDRLFGHGVAQPSTGTGQGENAIELTAKGIEVYENGGWKKYLIEFEKAEKEEKEKQKSIIITGGNAVIGNNNQNVNQGLDSRFDIKSKNDIKQIPIETPKPKSSQDIWDKLKSIAQIVGFGTALIALITKIMDLW